MDPSARAVSAARQLLADAGRIVVSTGAGISAEAGVPTFRGEGGLWRRHRPEDLATPGAFARDPLLVWGWYGWRREKVAACTPTAAHRALAELALSRPGVTLVTQNVDGLHTLAARQAGGDRDVAAALPLCLHGDLFRVRCRACGARREHRGAIDASSLETLPRCPGCGGLERPDVVWFGEPLPRSILERSLEAAAIADVCVVIGTSNLVYPAAAVPLATLENGGVVVEVNPEPTPLSARAAVWLPLPASQGVPAICEGLAVGGGG